MKIRNHEKGNILKIVKYLKNIKTFSKYFLNIKDYILKINLYFLNIKKY